MKVTGLAVLLLFPLAMSGQNVSKQRMSQPAGDAAAFPLKLHVTRSFGTEDGEVAYLHLAGVLDGQDVELATLAPRGATLLNTPLVPLGDYAARLTGQDQKKNGAVLRQYDLLLANGQHEIFALVAMSR